jgi:serralysin
MATGNVFIDTLAGVSWLDVGGDRNITYYFDETPLTHRLWTVAETVAWQSALQQWANVANITTQSVSSQAGADLIETWQTFLYMQDHHGGNIPSYHDLPNASGHAVGEFNTQGRFTYFSLTGMDIGGQGFSIFLETIGHALGLTNTLGFPGGGYDQDLYSVMSHNQGTKTSSGSVDFGHVMTPMAFDIAAIQSMYGPNVSYRAGSDTYVLPGINAPRTSWQCIWDTGGVDTIRYDGSLSATIDLRAATLVNGDPNAGGPVSQAAGIFGGYTIANGVVIENAIGGKGNDTLIGNSADNTLYGGAGDDTVIFSGPQSAYTVTDLGGSVRVTGPEGTDTLISIEHMLFSGGVTPGNNNVLFDAAFYLSHNPDVSQAGVDALNHFNTFGWREGRNPDAFFDTSWYRALYKDAAGTNPLDHYHATGWKKGYDPGPHFDTKLYLIHNPDVAAAGIDPLEHYLRHGAKEGRAIYAANGDAVSGFDAQYYLLHNPDVAAAGVDPLQHFNTYGWHEGRNPNAWFDTTGYLSHYTDVAAAGVNPLQHYEQFGWREGRDPSTQFDTLKYLAAYGDVAAAGVNPFDHFLQNGIYEGRSPQGDGLWH